MNSIALLLVLSAALIHATWNLLIKKAGGGPVFLWMFATLSSVVLVPSSLLLLIIRPDDLTLLGVGFIAGTTLIHLFYFLALQRGYQSGDLSLVYPLARGLGPTLATVGAMILLAERPSSVALVGLLLIVLGTVLLAYRGRGATISHPRAGIVYGIITGILIATYTVWDKFAVSDLKVPPLVLESFAGCGISLMLAPYSLRRWGQVKDVWRQNRTEVVGVAILAPLSYILVLTAMSFTPLSYVAPTREISILFAAMLGSRFLGEGQATRRIIAAGSMVCGVIALAIG